MTVAYSDGWNTCTDDEILVRGYYFPWGTKRIPYARIRSVRRVQLSPTRGRGRIWGTANYKYWANLDWNRTSKKVALILDLGGRVHPFLTPNDPEAALDAIRQHADIEVVDEGARGPII